MARTGRPRKARDNEGNIVAEQPTPGPTPEMMALFDFRVGQSRRGDPCSPMGVLVAHGKVDEQIRSQITTPYMVAKKKCFGPYTPAMAGDGTARGHDGSDSDAAERRARRVIAKCDKVLKRLKYDSNRNLFDAIVVREEWPVWMTPRPGEHDIVVDPKSGEVRYTRRLRLDDDNPELLLILAILGQLAELYHLKPTRLIASTVVARNFQQADPAHAT